MEKLSLRNLCRAHFYKEIYSLIFNTKGVRSIVKSRNNLRFSHHSSFLISLYAYVHTCYFVKTNTIRDWCLPFSYGLLLWFIILWQYWETRIPILWALGRQRMKLVSSVRTQYLLQPSLRRRWPCSEVPQRGAGLYCDCS